jgi:hypothetical protein
MTGFAAGLLLGWVVRSLWSARSRWVDHRAMLLAALLGGPGSIPELWARVSDRRRPPWLYIIAAGLVDEELAIMEHRTQPSGLPVAVYRMITATSTP